MCTTDGNEHQREHRDEHPRQSEDGRVQEDEHKGDDDAEIERLLEIGF